MAPGAAGFGAGPEAITFMMLGSGDDIFGAGTMENIGPLVRVPKFDPEERGELFIIEILAVVLFVELPPGIVGFLIGHALPVPFGILFGSAPTGDRVDAPMDENAELGIGEPTWGRALIQRRPFGGISSGSSLGRQEWGYAKGKDQGGTGTECRGASRDRVHGFEKFMIFAVKAIFLWSDILIASGSKNGYKSVSVKWSRRAQAI
jgi:hypothetical protein